MEILIQNYITIIISTFEPIYIIPIRKLSLKNYDEIQKIKNYINILRKIQIEWKIKNKVYYRDIYNN